MTDTKRYQAFISYRHADNKEEGRQWATWLHQAIETYDVPKDLMGKKTSRGSIIPERIYPIFRDEQELPADSDLGGVITRALDDSELLIVLCSPNAVASTYVADEIDYFKTQGGSNRIIAAMINGEPNTSWDKSKLSLGFSESDECFPIPLQFEYDDQCVRTEKHAEPIAADFRINNGGMPEQGWTSPEAYQTHLKTNTNLKKKEIEAKVELYEVQHKLMLLKIIAGIIGVPLGELTQRDKEFQLQQERLKAKRLRQWLSGVAVLAILAIGAGIFAFIQQTKAEANEIIAQKQTVIAQQQKVIADDNAIKAKQQEAIAKQNEKIAKEQTIIAEQQSNIAKEQRSLAIKQRDAALLTQSHFLMDQARQSNVKGEYDKALLLALNAVPGIYGGERPHVLFDLELRTAALNSNKHLILERQNMAGDFAMSPDGKTFVIPEKKGASYIWSVATGEKLEVYNKKSYSGIKKSIFSPDEQTIASSDGQFIYFYSINDKTSKEVIELDRKDSNSYGEFDLAFNHDGTQISIITNTNSVYVFDVLTQKQLQVFKHQSTEYVSNLHVSFSPNGQWLLSALSNNDVYVWSLETGEEALFVKSAENNNLSKRASRLPFITKQGILVFYDSEGTSLWSIKEKKQSEKHDGLHAVINFDGSDIAFLSPRTTSFNFTADENEKAKGIYLYNIKNKIGSNLRHGFNPIEDAIFSPDGQYILTVDQISSHLWSTDKGIKIRSFAKLHLEEKLKFSKDSKYLFSSDRISNKTLTVFNIETSIPSLSIQKITQQGYGNSLLSPSASSLVNKLVTYVDEDPKNNLHELYFWSTIDGSLIKKQQINCKGVIKLSPLKNYVILGCHGNKADVYFSMADGEKIVDPNAKFLKGRFSSNEQYFINIKNYDPKSIIEFKTQKTLKTFTYDDGIKQIRFSPLKDEYITLGRNGDLKRWDIAKNKSSLIYQVKGNVEKFMLSPNGEFILIYIRKGDLILISSADGAETIRMRPKHLLSNIKFSPNNQYLLTINKLKNASLNIWSIPNSSKIQSQEKIDDDFKSSLKTISPFNRFADIELHPNNNLLLLINGLSSKVYSLETAHEFLDFDNSVIDVSRMTFTADGQQLLVLANDGNLQTWPLYGTELIEQSIKKLPINRKCLSVEERQKIFLKPLTAEQIVERGCHD